jgi:ParB family transcriptional regulator, chromosome partitioning protein
MADNPHVTHNSGEIEWYTPSCYIESARAVMGSIDLDPASCEHANLTVRAANYFSAHENGLIHSWSGKVWMNPPYRSKLMSAFCNKFAEEVRNNNITEGIVLVNNATETRWFQSLIKEASGVVFANKRIRLLSKDGERKSPLQGQAFLYFGERPDKFMRIFGKYGWGSTNITAEPERNQGINTTTERARYKLTIEDDFIKITNNRRDK